MKGVYIFGCIAALSFSLAYAANEMSIQKKIQQERREKIVAFQKNGIDVVFENKSTHIAPININTFPEEVGAKLAIPLQEKKSAYVTFSKNQYIVQPEMPGLSLNREDLINNLDGRFRTFSTVPIVATLTVTPPEVTKDELSSALPDLKKIFNVKQVLTSKDFSFSMYFRERLDWLIYKKTINSETGNSQIQAVIQDAPFSAYLEQNWGKEINREPTKVTITKDEKEKIIFEGHGKNGFTLNSEKLKGLLQEVLGGKSIKIELPIDEKPFITSISEDLQTLGIKDVIAIGHTSYYGSPQNRMHNINTGISRFNGLLIPQNDTFSFNSHLGEVDGEHGFLKELVIKPEGTIPEFGGGICQVSTTAYRGALYAGLPIIERNPHSYAVSYYSQIGGHGIDATIYPGGSDLRFKNDTPGSILLQSYTEDAEAYFVFYGTKDGREVKLEGPVISNRNSIGGVEMVETTAIPPGTQKQVERAHVGFDTLWYRYLTLPGGLTQKEPIVSKYHATQDKILVGVEKLTPKTDAVVPKDTKAILD